MNSEIASESPALKSLRNAIITQAIQVAITFVFVGFISLRTFYEFIPASPNLRFFLIPFVMIYLTFGLFYILFLFLWMRWRKDPGKHKKGLLYSSLVLALTSLFPPLLFGLIPAVLVYFASSRA